VTRILSESILYFTRTFRILRFLREWI